MADEPLFTVSGPSVSMLYPFDGVENPQEDVSFPYPMVRQTAATSGPSGNVLLWGVGNVLMWGTGNDLEWGA